MSSIGDFTAAARRSGESTSTEVVEVEVAGLGVQVTLAGEPMIDTLRRGLLAAETPLSEIHAELYAFESAHSGVQPPPPPWPATAFDGRRQEIAGFTEPPLIANYSIDHASLSFWDEDARAGVQWFRDSALMAPGEGGAPMRNLLRWALAARGAHLLHCASAGGILFGGPGGAGKSTSSLSMALAGLDFTSDDFSVVTLDDDGPAAHAVYACIKATDSTLELLPELAGFGEDAGRDWRGKLRRDVRERITRSQPIHAVVLPEVAERVGVPRAVSSGEALRRLTGGSLPVMVGGMARTIAGMRALLDQVPAYSLPVGPDTENIALAVAPLVAAGSSV